MENLDYKNQNTDRKQPFRSRKIFYGIEGQRIEGQRKKIKKSIVEIFYNLIIVSKDDMDKFEEQEMQKTRPNDCLIKQSVMEEKPKIIRD